MRGMLKLIIIWDIMAFGYHLLNYGGTNDHKKGDNQTHWSCMEKRVDTSS